MSNKSEAVNIMPDVDIDMEVVNTYLKMEYKLFSAMEPEELGEIVWLLKQYSLFLKTEYNKYNARSRWAYNKLFKMVKPQASNYDSYDKDERFYSAVKESNGAVELLEIKNKNNEESSLLEGVDSSVKYLIKMLEGLYFYKLERKINESTREN